MFFRWAKAYLEKASVGDRCGQRGRDSLRAQACARKTFWRRPRRSPERCDTLSCALRTARGASPCPAALTLKTWRRTERCLMVGVSERDRSTWRFWDGVSSAFGSGGSGRWSGRGEWFDELFPDIWRAGRIFGRDRRHASSRRGRRYGHRR